LGYHSLKESATYFLSDSDHSLSYPPCPKKPPVGRHYFISLFEPVTLPRAPLTFVRFWAVGHPTNYDLRLADKAPKR